MGIYSRYVFRQALLAVTMILLTLMLIIWVSVALREMKLMTSDGQGAGVFLYMTTLAMPQIIGIVMPVALLIACLHVLNKLAGDSEIIVLAASGAGRWQLARPLLAMGFIIMLLVIGNNVWLQPSAQRELRRYIIKVRTDLIAHVLQPGKFTTPVNNLTFHIRAREKNGDIMGFILHDSRNPAQTMSYMAERSHLIKRGSNAYMIMQNGHIHRLEKKSGKVQIIAFDKYIFDLSRFGQARGKALSHKPHESYMHELWSPSPDNAYYRSRPGSFRAELHDRISNPLYPILFVLVAVAMLGYARTTRENSAKSVGIAFGIAALARLGGVMAVNLLAKKEFAIFLVYGIPLAGIVLAVIVIQTRGTGNRTRRKANDGEAKTSEGRMTANSGGVL